MHFLIPILLAVACLPSMAFAQDETQGPAKPAGSIALRETVDKALPQYVPQAEKPSGTIAITCSPLTRPLMNQWATAFRAISPNVKFKIESARYSFNIVRNDGYREEPEFGFLFESSGYVDGVLDPNRGKNCWPVIVALDQLEIIVHATNPIKKLDADQLAWIYSNQGDGRGDLYKNMIQDSFSGDATTRKKKARHADELLNHPRIDRWAQLGNHAPAIALDRLKIFAREQTDCDSDFLELRTVGFPIYGVGTTIIFPRMPRDDVRRITNASAMVRAVAKDKAGIGYVSHSVNLNGVRTVKIEGEPIELTGRQRPKDEPYHVELPVLARPVFLWVTLNDDPARTPAQQEFLKFILSHNGQKVVADNRFFPLPADLAGKQLKTAIKTPEPPMKEVDPLDPFDSRR